METSGNANGLSSMRFNSCVEGQRSAQGTLLLVMAKEDTRILHEANKQQREIRQ